jgi:hypothetical protein
MNRFKPWAAACVAFLTVIFISSFFQGERKHYLRFKDAVVRTTTPYPALISTCRSVAGSTADTDLKFVAEYNVRAAEVMHSAGYKSHQDAIDKGKLNQFTQGLAISILSPARGLDISLKSAGLWWDEAKYKEAVDRVVQRYDKPILWPYLVAAVIGFLAYQHFNRISLQSSRTPIVDAQPLNATDDLLVCPKCAARNRRKTVQPGQSIICGQCKTVLLSV